MKLGSSQGEYNDSIYERGKRAGIKARKEETRSECGVASRCTVFSLATFLLLVFGALPLPFDPARAYADEAARVIRVRSRSR